MSIDISSLTTFSGNCQVKFWKTLIFTVDFFYRYDEEVLGERFSPLSAGDGPLLCVFVAHVKLKVCAGVFSGV